MIIYQAMVENNGDIILCSYLGTDNNRSFQCSVPNALQKAKTVLEIALGVRLTLPEAKEWLCHAGGRDCIVYPELEKFGSHSTYAKPV